MACVASELVADSRCLADCMSPIELLASIACSLATQNGMSCDAATLKAQGRCLVACMSEIELLASIACSLADGGSGGVRQWFNGNGAPSGFQTGQTPGVPSWYQDLDTGIIWADSTGIGTWSGPN